VGDERALDALEAGLESPHEDVSSMCAWCLGATGRAEAARALTGALQRARRARRLHLAGAVIRSLGRLGREDPVPELRRILARRSLFRRRELHDLKLQALDALAKLPGEEARETLEAVAAGPDMSLAVAARRAAKQRAEDGEKA
jgi:HEAT repeat protein